ncbi:hypothetical protein PHYSODRAFT_399436, partial [Phytophthora sojae]
PEHEPRVNYYIDGVNENMFYGILQTEMRGLRNAFKLILDDCNSPFTFASVNQ